MRYFLHGLLNQSLWRWYLAQLQWEHDYRNLDHVGSKCGINGGGLLMHVLKHQMLSRQCLDAYGE